MSLDAFGTPTPPRTDEGHIDEATLEELLEEYDSEVESDTSEAIQTFQEKNEAVPTFRHTSLSTIPESSSASTRDLTLSSLGSTSGLPFSSTPYFTPGIPEQTPYFTPDETSSLPSLRPGNLPLPKLDSPFLPPGYRGRASAPPLGVTQKLLEAHGEHARALQQEVERAREVILELEKALREKDCGRCYAASVSIWLMGSISHRSVTRKR
jgi:hypothetical protein